VALTDQLVHQRIAQEKYSIYATELETEVGSATCLSRPNKIRSLILAAPKATKNLNPPPGHHHPAPVKLHPCVATMGRAGGGDKNKFTTIRLKWSLHRI